MGRLIRSQCPGWSDLPITPVVPGGWDHRMFRLGDDMVVRLPSAERYILQVDKEQRWLPRLAPYLPLPIPEPLTRGEPAEGYPWPWSVYRWRAGESATTAAIGDAVRFASTLAEFLTALQRVDVRNGPAPGPHNFHRGGPVSTYDAETRRAIAALGHTIDARSVTAVWDDGLRSSWTGAPVWVHGDVAAGNLLVEDGRLRAVIDFGSCGVGDPACDLVIAWTFFDGESRAAFRSALPYDAGTWARARSWALWKALIVAADGERRPIPAAEARRVIAPLLADAGSSPGRSAK